MMLPDLSLDVPDARAQLHVIAQYMAKASLIDDATLQNVAAATTLTR